MKKLAEHQYLRQVGQGRGARYMVRWTAGPLQLATSAPESSASRQSCFAAQKRANQTFLEWLADRLNRKDCRTSCGYKNSPKDLSNLKASYT